MWNTDGGSMRGSGIYAEDVVIDFECSNEECGHEEKLDAVTDDWGQVGDIECPKCGEDTNCDKEYEPDCDPDYGDES
jgi:hypothetical protein